MRLKASRTGSAQADLYKESRRRFLGKAHKMGFNQDQAWFLWENLICTETLKKQQNLIEGLQKERDFNR